jgi:hypothetical protein
VVEHLEIVPHWHQSSWIVQAVNLKIRNMREQTFRDKGKRYKRKREEKPAGSLGHVIGIYLLQL